MKTAFANLPPTSRGAVYMVLATVAWAGLILLVRVLSDRYSTFELLFFRNLVSILLLTPWMLRAGRGALRTQRLPMHTLRTALAYFGMLGMFYGIAHIPLGEVVALGFTQPLFISLLAGILLGEAVGRHRWAALGGGFIGVLVILRPGFADVGLATLVVLGSAVVYAGSNICIKALMSTDTPVQATIYVNLMMLPLSLVPTVFDWVTPAGLDLIWLLGVGVTGTLGVYFASRAYQAADASAVVPYDFMRLVFAAFGAYVLFNEPVDLWTWAGALIIFTSAYALVRAEAGGDRVSRKVSPQRRRGAEKND